MNKALVIAFVLLSLVTFSNSFQHTSKDTSKDILSYKTEVKTISKFSDKEVIKEEDIPFEQKFENDPNTEFGKLTKTQEGKNGKTIKTFVANLYNEAEVDKKLIKTETVQPITEIYKKGSKISYKEETSERCGKFKYWHKYEKVYMTTYTPQCEGCDAWTSIGLKAGYGIIAVDPKKIPYWTKVCIPGYGIAIAGDTGGAMRSYKGLLIDLGFNSLEPKDKWLTTGRYDMYILNNESKADNFYLEVEE